MTFEPDYKEPEFSYRDLVLALRRIKELEAEVAQLRSATPVRPSLEVLQRMANGIDRFDIGRFKCAMAALPHETPKLSATVGMFGQFGIGDQLDMRRGRKESITEQLNRRGMRVIEGAGDTNPDAAFEPAG